MPDSAYVGRLAPWMYDETTASGAHRPEAIGKIQGDMDSTMEEGMRRMVARKTNLPDDLEATVAPADDSMHREQDSIKSNPYVAFAEMFADDSFADEVDAYITAERHRQREEAAARARK